MPESPQLGQIGWLVARDVNRTFGGGWAAIELLRRSCVRRGWLNDSGHAVLIAVSRLTPGTNLLAYTTGLGWTWGRLPGAIVALVASSLPSAVMIATLSATLARIDERPAIQFVLGIATLAASVLVLSSAWFLLRPYVRHARRAWLAIAVAVALTLSLLGATPVRVLLTLAVWGALTPDRRPRSGELEKDRVRS